MNLNCQRTPNHSGDNFFNRLPNEIVLLILQKLQDAKSLCSSMSVCKRFHSIVPQVQLLFLSIPRRRSAAMKKKSHQTAGYKNLAMKHVHSISEKIQSIRRSDHIDFYIDNKILKSFPDIRTLHLRVPCRRRRQPEFLKWKAEFAGDLRICVVLLAPKMWIASPKKKVNSGNEPPARMLDKDWKSIFFWTLSCIRAACHRHYMVQEIIELGMESVVVSDEIGQGKMCMDREHIQEAKVAAGTEIPVKFKSRVPGLKWYVWFRGWLEAPDDSGKVMKGATLVVVKPDDDEDGRSLVEILAERFRDDKELMEVVKKFQTHTRYYQSHTRPYYV